MSQVILKDLVKAGVHIGHIKSRWFPAMAPYIWGVKSNIHLIDVSKTAYQLENAAKFLESVAAAGKPILWVGTKKAARDTVESHALKIGASYVTHRWIGGTLTNFPQVKKSITKLLHFEEIASKSTDEYLYTKKEINRFQKLADRLSKNVGGIRKLSWPIGAIVIVDVKKEQAAVREAIAAGVPIVAMVDTNSDPSGIQYVIPANDDAPRSIAFIIDFLAQAAQRGKEQAAAQAIKEAKKPKEELETKQVEIAVETEVDDEDEAPVKEKKITKKIAKKVDEEEEVKPQPKQKDTLRVVKESLLTEKKPMPRKKVDKK